MARRDIDALFDFIIARRSGGFVLGGADLDNMAFGGDLSTWDGQKANIHMELA